jgi:hypothetical protein
MNTNGSGPSQCSLAVPRLLKCAAAADARVDSAVQGPPQLAGTLDLLLKLQHRLAI